MAPRLGKDGITAKQRKLVNGVVMGKTARQAALDAGFKGTDGSVSAMASRELKNVKVAAAIEAALDRAGASLDESARVIAEAHRAKTVKSFKTVDDRIIYAEPTVDHNARMKAAELNGKFRGLLKSNEDMGGQVMGIGFFILKGLKERGL